MEEIKKEIIEKVILVAVADQDTTEAEESLDELEELVKTAGDRGCSKGDPGKRNTTSRNLYRKR